MKPSTLAVLLAVIFPVSTHAASIGIYAGGVSIVSTWASDIVPTIDLEIRDLEYPLKAIELTIGIPDELQEHLDCVEVPGVTVTRNEDRFTIRLDDCWSARSDYSVPLFSLLGEADTAQSICLGPANPGSPLEPPAITYETCGGEVLPLDLAPARWSGEEIAVGCLLVAAARVPATEGTLGTLKAWY